MRRMKLEDQVSKKMSSFFGEANSKKKGGKGKKKWKLSY